MNYRFKINISQNQWTYTNNSTIDLLNLSPGDYEILIEAKNVNGNWIRASSSFSFFILNPWYKTWWAYVLYICSTIGVIGAAFILRGKR